MPELCGVLSGVGLVQLRPIVSGIGCQHGISLTLITSLLSEPGSAESSGSLRQCQLAVECDIREIQKLANLEVYLQEYLHFWCSGLL